MSDGVRRFSVTRLPRDTARLLEHIVEEAARWGAMVTTGLADSPSEREQYTVLCYARKELAEHLEMLCEAAGVEEQEDDAVLRFT